MIMLKNLPPRYLRVAEAILDGTTRPCDIAHACGLAMTTTQKYIAEMRDEGYLARVKRGHYAVNPHIVLIPFDRMKAVR